MYVIVIAQVPWICGSKLTESEAKVQGQGWFTLVTFMSHVSLKGQIMTFIAHLALK